MATNEALPALESGRARARSRCGSFEVCFPWDGRPSRYFYFENLPDRRLRPEHLTREEAFEQAKALV